MREILDRLARAAAKRDDLTRRELIGRRATGKANAASEHRLDGIARALAGGPVSRRVALRAAGAGIVVTGALGARPSHAAQTICSDMCPMNQFRCAPDPLCTSGNDYCCQNGGVCCGPATNGTYQCCPPPVGSIVGWQCCPQAPGGDQCCPQYSGQPPPMCCVGVNAGTAFLECCNPQTDVCDPSYGCRNRQCASNQTPCGPTCCDPGHSCCDSTSGVCCPSGQDCLRQIVPGQSGITPSSPDVCCPPGRAVRLSTGNDICCPPGSVPSNGSLTGRLCCASANVCGDDCCDSTPSFPKKCTSTGCQFDLGRILGKQATVDNRGNAPLSASFAGPANGTLTLQSSPSGRSADAAAVTVLGKTTFHVRRAGKVKLKVRLTQPARHRLARSKRLSVTAIITFTEQGKQTSSSHRLVLTRPR